jgi:putative holliday junction resolvase
MSSMPNLKLTDQDLPAVALDVGIARIGFAVSDTTGRFAFPRGFVKRIKLTTDIAAVKNFMQQENAELVVVGLPLRTDGAYSGQTQRVRAFAKDLERAGIRIALQDERFTTKLANSQLLITSNKRDRLEKGLTDAQSAVIILETFLEKRRLKLEQTLKSEVEPLHLVEQDY